MKMLRDMVATWLRPWPPLIKIRVVGLKKPQFFPVKLDYIRLRFHAPKK